MARDFYQDLGVARTATTEEIRKAYRKLAAKLHPDKHPDDPKAEERFKAVNSAYHALTDDKKRALYDEFGEDALREGFNADAARAYRSGGAGGYGRAVNMEDYFAGGQVPGGFGDLFGDLFGARSARRRTQRRGADMASEVAIDFQSAIRGAELKMTVEGAKEVTVRVPPGADDGDKVRVHGHGGAGAMGGEKGDLILTVRVRPHPVFRRDGLDLELDLPITVAEAFRGAKVRVPTPSGEVTMSVPRHAQSGQVARLKGKGVERKGQTGDLYVRFMIQLPGVDSPELEDAVQKLDKAQGEDVRAKIRF
jgi:DnaJ-class molecular chaperone